MHADESGSEHPESEWRTERVWMVERTFSADSPHILMTVYATSDGSRYLQKERAFNRFGTGSGPEVTATITVESERLTPVTDAETRDRYANEAECMRARHDPDTPV